MSLRREEVLPYLATRELGRGMYCWAEEMPSTNGKALELARKGAPAGTLAVCERQTAGRGRLNRTWESRPGEDLTLSVILQVQPERICLYPLAVSLAGVRAIREVCPGSKPKIKWPNDLLLEGKKVGGILCALTGDRLVAGIGINGNRQDFPEELQCRATSLKKSWGEISLPRLMGCFLNHLEETIAPLERGNREELLASYRPLCATLGRRVQVLESQGQWIGTALEVTGEGALQVRDEQGTVHCVYAGDVSVRGLMGYVDEGEDEP